MHAKKVTVVSPCDHVISMHKAAGLTSLSTKMFPFGCDSATKFDSALLSVAA